MKYAVFDWDNTIRKGFTLFSWMDFLYKENVLNKNVQSRIKRVQIKYNSGEINHDEYAKIACAVYAEAMKGVTKEKRNQLLRNYFRYDQRSIFPFAESVFQCMHRYGIKPVIISGAPDYIIERYRKRFSLYMIFGFCESYDGSICTGQVKYNYGMNKRETIDKLYDLYGEKPIVGFGDSYSDIPIFEMSCLSFCVTSNQGDIYRKPYGQNVHYVKCSASKKQMVILLEKILKETTDSLGLRRGAF